MDDDQLPGEQSFDSDPPGNGGIVTVVVMFIIVLLLLYVFRRQLGLGI